MSKSLSRAGRSPRVYVASSWKNERQPKIVAVCRHLGFETYDFRNPSVEGPETDGSMDHGFSWHGIDPNWAGWNVGAYREALEHPLAKTGLRQDLAALEWADLLVLVQPCGLSSHLELGWAIGRGKTTVVWYPFCTDSVTAELMPGLANAILYGYHELGDWLTRYLANGQVQSQESGPCEGGEAA